MEIRQQITEKKNGPALKGAIICHFTKITSERKVISEHVFICVSRPTRGWKTSRLGLYKRCNKAPSLVAISHTQYTHHLSSLCNLSTKELHTISINIFFFPRYSKLSAWTVLKSQRRHRGELLKSRRVDQRVWLLEVSRLTVDHQRFVWWSTGKSWNFEKPNSLVQSSRLFPSLFICLAYTRSSFLQNKHARSTPIWLTVAVHTTTSPPVLFLIEHLLFLSYFLIKFNPSAVFLFSFLAQNFTPFPFRTKLSATPPRSPYFQRRRSGRSVMASDFGSNGPRFESGRGRCVESLDKALYSHCPKEKPSH